MSAKDHYSHNDVYYPSVGDTHIASCDCCTGTWNVDNDDPPEHDEDCPIAEIEHWEMVESVGEGLLAKHEETSARRLLALVEIARLLEHARISTTDMAHGWEYRCAAALADVRLELTR